MNDVPCHHGVDCLECKVRALAFENSALRAELGTRERRETALRAEIERMAVAMSHIPEKIRRMFMSEQESAAVLPALKIHPVDDKRTKELRLEVKALRKSLDLDPGESERKGGETGRAIKARGAYTTRQEA